MPLPAIAGAIGSTAMGLMLERHNDRRQVNQQRKLQNLQLEGNKDMANYNYGLQMKMWDATNYKAQVEQLEKAGLNPGLIYGMGGGGGATTATAGGQGASGGQAPSGGGEAIMGLERGMQLALLKAQKENIEADTANKQGDAANKPKVGANLDANTENTILEQVITKYAGKEAQDVYERIKAPNRGVEAKTYQDELEARQGVAGTIYELWVEGKLKEKSVAEIEGLLLDNANKTLQGEQLRAATREIYKKMELLEENIKGAKLDNIINEIETKMQQETGIDRSAPTWLKILGRMFGGLLSR